MNIHINSLSASDLNWLIWGAVFVIVLLAWTSLRNKRLLVQNQQQLTALAIELKKISNNLNLLLNNSGIDVSDGDEIDETKLYVGNIDYAATETELAAHFAKFGNIALVNIPVDRYSGRARGFGFVTFKRPADALKAMALDGSEFKGRQIQVNFARERATSN